MWQLRHGWRAISKCRSLRADQTLVPFEVGLDDGYAVVCSCTSSSCWPVASCASTLASRSAISAATARSWTASSERSGSPREAVPLGHQTQVASCSGRCSPWVSLDPELIVERRRPARASCVWSGCHGRRSSSTWNQRTGAKSRMVNQREQCDCWSHPPGVPLYTLTFVCH